MAKYGKQNPYHKRFRPVDGITLVHNHPLYDTWCHMKERCQNSDAPRFKDYGGRGVSVCDRWNKSFENFASDMGPKPSDRHSLDRIDNDGNYEPGNCRWATRSEQMLNRRLFKSNTTGNRGVLFKDGRFEARVDFQKTRYNLGRFSTLEEAEDARQKFSELLLVDKETALAMTDRRVRFDSSTGVRGVTKHVDGGFIVRKTINKVRIYLGYVKTLEEAVALWTEHK